MRARDASEFGLLERDAELEAIDDALDRASAGSGAVLFIAGAAGIGKTSLLDASKRAAEQSGFKVASAVGSPMETGLPFGLIGQAIVALGGSEVDDPVELERLGGQSARLYRMFRWLLNIAGERPLLLALDDLHWSDPDSLELIGFLARRLAGCSILLLGSLRAAPDPAWVLARELVGSGHVGMLTLARLTVGASRALLERDLSRQLDPDQYDGIVSACAGTPLLLKTAAANLSDGGFSPPPSRVNSGFRSELLLERFAGVGDDAFTYVRAASIVGVRFRPELTGAIAELDSARWRDTHRQLVRAGLLEDLPEGEARFVHPLFAQALLDSQSPSDREHAHMRAFRLLADGDAPAALAANHAVAARLHGDPLAVEVTARAGREALAQGALEAACAHLGNAVELAGAGAESALLLEYASALASRARMDEVEKVCARVMARTGLDEAVRARALVLLSRGTILAGRPADAEALYEEAASTAARASDLAGEASVLLDASSNLYTVSPLGWTLAIMGRALAVLPANDPGRPSVEFANALARLEAGDPSGEQPLERAIRVWSSQRNPSDSGWAWTMATNAINALKLLEDLQAATDLFEREFARAVDAGAPLTMTALAVSYADAVWRMGDARKALELIERAVALSVQPITLWSDLGFAVALSELGRDNEAEPYIAALRSLRARLSVEYYAAQSLWLCVLDGRRLLATGERERASDLMLHAAEVARLSGWRHPLIVPWAGFGIEVHLAAGRIDAARDLIEELDELSRPLSCRWPRAIVALGCAQLAAADGRATEADEQFLRALTMFEEVPMPIFRAEALVTYGSYLRHNARPREAREPLARALALCEQAGAERVARLARAELAAAGGRGRRRAASDSAELTGQEERVAMLVAQGMTNAQIGSALGLSPKTIGHYLERIYAKLGIRSRHELTAHVHRKA